MSICQVGRAVEIAGLEQEGFAYSWAAAKVVEVLEDPAHVLPVLVLHYDEFVDDDGKPEREELSARSWRLRPAWPAASSPTDLAAYEVGCVVDVLQDDIWWNATVVSTEPRKGVEVLFRESSETRVVKDAAQLRPGKEWVGGAWRDRAPEPIPAKYLRQAPRQQQQDPEPEPAPKQKQKQQAKGKAGRGGRQLKENSRAAAGQGVMVRRSQRERTERVIMVDGIPVLKANNYDIESGERSVFDQELKRPKRGAGELAGPSATWVALEPERPPPRQERPARARKATGRAAAAAAAANGEEDSEDEGPAKAKRAAGSSSDSEDEGEAGTSSEGEEEEDEEEEEEIVILSPRVVVSPIASPMRAPSEAQTARRNLLAHNEMIRQAGKAAEPRRFLFLEQQLPVLQTFIGKDVVQKIRAKADQARTLGPFEAPTPVEFQPESITATMREYQLEGLRWLVSRFDHGVNAILADEMGLGKTLQTISFLAHLKFDRRVEGPHLVVVPLSVLPSWMSEFAKWCPEMRVVRVHTNDADERNRIKKEVLSNPSSFDVAVTTYDTIRSQHWGTALSRTIRWRYLVMDEGHKIKNEETQIAAAMRHVQCQNVLLLTGTPLQNNLHELWALLNFMYPEVFPSSEVFDDAFDLTHHKVDNAKLEAAHHLLKPFCLRRLKEEVERGMPPKVETRINCPLSAMQTFWYRRLLLKDKAAVQSIEREVEGSVKFNANDNNWKKLMMLVMQLRKCCSHPYLFGTSAEPDFDGETTGEDIVAASGKLEVLDRLLAKLQARGHRVVLFSQFNMMLDILEDFVNMRGYKYCRLDGSTNRVRRMIDMKLWNRPGSDLYIYLLNTRAGGLGVNLQTADTVVLYDSDWNPQWDLQAMARVHRIGQTKPVHIYRLCTEGTVEERIQNRAEKKLYLDQMVNRGSISGVEELEGLSKKEVLSMLKFGADRIFQNSEGRPPSDAELDAIIDRSKMTASMAGEGAEAAPAQGAAVKEEKEEGDAAAGAAPAAAAAPAAIRDVHQTAADFDAEQQPLSSYILNGTDYREVGSLKDIGKAFWAQHKDDFGRAQRERKKRTVNIGGFDVLRVNNYGMDKGEPSVFEREAAGLKERCGKKRNKLQIAGRDYDWQDFCQVCWDGGDLVCCDGCPAAYHPECLGLSLADIEAQPRWVCPQHACCVCTKKSGAVGGMLFRCEVCPQAYCEDHLSPDADVVVHSQRFQELGQQHPSVACFIRCTPDCSLLAERIYKQAEKEGRSASRQVTPAQPALLPPPPAQPLLATAAAAAAAAMTKQAAAAVKQAAASTKKQGGHVSGRASGGKSNARLSNFVAPPLPMHPAAAAAAGMVPPMVAVNGVPNLNMAMQMYLQAAAVAAAQQQRAGGGPAAGAVPQLPNGIHASAAMAAAVQQQQQVLMSSFAAAAAAHQQLAQHHAQNGAAKPVAGPPPGTGVKVPLAEGAPAAGRAGTDTGLTAAAVAAAAAYAAGQKRLAAQPGPEPSSAKKAKA